MGAYSFDGNTPRVHPGAFIHPEATLIGRVILEEGSYVGAGAVLRGDLGVIHLERESNVQENCVLHTFPNRITKICFRAHIGHSSVIHGAVIGGNCLVGISSVVLDDSTLEENVILGALSLVPKKSVLKSGYLYFGRPAKLIRKLSIDELVHKTVGTELYIALSKENGLVSCAPLICDRPENHNFIESKRVF
jgi:phenylacetic acid degradation protein|tara:strand:- start:694 stop:1269 length:576 start_codon:yes stop_codon:yes gene_type:complete